MFQRRTFAKMILSAVCLFAGIGGCTNREKNAAGKGTSGKPSHHLANGKFQNLYNPTKEKSIFDLWKWQSESNPPEPVPLGLAKNNSVALQSNRSAPTLTWIGHATVLLQYNGVNILTDPHFTERASPVSFAGPKRFTPPGLKIDELPAIDVILISHNHYDHLDADSIKAIYERFKDRPPRILVPLRLKTWFDSLGIPNVEEYDWWDAETFDNMTAHAVPARHWSSRRGYDARKTLWCGWVLEFPDFKFHFVGDTGASPVFDDIYKRFGPMDLAAIPIGAYEPRWFMQEQHVNPDEAVEIHRQLHSKRSVAIHWGTFQLTDEPTNEPPLRLAAARKAVGVPETEFFVMQPGETKFL